MKWSELSMTEKNEVIKMAVAQGIRDIPSIKNLYEESVNGSRRFEDGGGLANYPEGNKYKLGGPKRNRMPAHPRRGNEEKDPEAIAAYQQYESDMAERRKVSAERAKQYIEEKTRRNIEAAKELNRRKDVVMSQLEDEASSIPFTSQEIQQATEEQRQEKLDKWGDYKKGINATITAAELGLSGASLLGAYANWKNWATAGNATKQAIANLLQKAQFPMQVAGTAIDGYQTYDALQNNDDSNAIYNGISTGLGVIGSLGAADIFPARVDRALDVMGIIQNSGDFIKYGYDSMFGNEKAEGGSIHIAPSKKGTFTAAASRHGMGVQEFASKVLSHPENYSLTMRKKANFARNASKWKH